MVISWHKQNYSGYYMRKTTEHAEAAKMIRNELKEAFPTVKFSVRSKSYSGGESININWENGPAESEIGKIVNKYEYGKFNGMDDNYEYSNIRKDIPQVKYLFTGRTFSKGMVEEIFENYKKTHKEWEDLGNLDERSPKFQAEWGYITPRNYIENELSKKNLFLKNLQDLFSACKEDN